MTIEEKLERFRESSMASSDEESRRMLKEHEDALIKIFEDHKEEALRRAQLEIKHEKERILREGNKELATQQLDIKRRLSEKDQALKEKLFVEVQDLLERFMETPAYKDYLLQKIERVRSFAKKEALIIYIDANDAYLMSELQSRSGVTLTLSQYTFGGGLRAHLPEKKILIDHSFSTRLAELKDNFVFDFRFGEEK